MLLNNGFVMRQTVLVWCVKGRVSEVARCFERWGVKVGTVYLTSQFCFSLLGSN